MQGSVGISLVGKTYLRTSFWSGTKGPWTFVGMVSAYVWILACRLQEARKLAGNRTCITLLPMKQRHLRIRPHRSNVAGGLAVQLFA